VRGVSTHQGVLGQTFPDFAGVSILTDKFLDLENVLIPMGGVPNGLLIGIGSLSVSTQVWNLNVP